MPSSGAPERGDKGFHVGRQRRSEAQALAGNGVQEGELRRMEGLAAKSCQRHLRRNRQVTGAGLESRTISGIAKQRVTEVLQVDSNLMRAPGLKHQAKQTGDGFALDLPGRGGGNVECLEHLVMR